MNLKKKIGVGFERLSLTQWPLDTFLIILLHYGKRLQLWEISDVPWAFRIRILVAWLLLSLTASAQASVSTRQLLCEALLAGHDQSRRSVLVTEGRELRDNGAILRGWDRWHVSDYRYLEGQLRNFEARSPRQEILLLEHFDRLEQHLVHRLLALAKAHKYNKRVESKQFGTVEIGAWRVELRSGEMLTATHTSSEEGGIAMEHAASALNALLVKAKINPTLITRVQYFHSHSRSPLLSEGDGMFLVFMKRALRQSGADVPVHIYAVLNVDGQPVTSHKSLR